MRLSKSPPHRNASPTAGKQPGARVRFSRLPPFCSPRDVNSVNLPASSHFLERKRGGPSLPRAAELCWLPGSLAGAQRLGAARNSPSRTSYRRAASQSPSPIDLGAIHLLELKNISQVSLLRTLESRPRLFCWVFFFLITFFAVTKSAPHVLRSLPFLRRICWEANEKSSAKRAACA